VNIRVGSLGIGHQTTTQLCIVTSI